MVEWFKGSIGEAIAEAKAKDTLFVVAVYAEDDASESLMSALADGIPQSSAELISIRIENGCERCEQFSQLYPVVIVPSVYFIDAVTGIDVEILSGIGVDAQKVINRPWPYFKYSGLRLNQPPWDQAKLAVLSGWLY